MKFVFNWANSLRENYVLINWWDWIWAIVAERAKVNIDLWNLLIAIFSLVLIYQVRIMTCFNSIQKINFSKKLPFKCIRKQIWPWHYVDQGQPRIITWTNFVGLTPPLLHTKSQGHQPSDSGEKDFEKVAILVIWPGPFEQTFVLTS